MVDLSDYGATKKRERERERERERGGTREHSLNETEERKAVAVASRSFYVA